MTDEIIVVNGPVLRLAKESESAEITVLAVQCIEACTCTFNDVKRANPVISHQQLILCSEVFLKYLRAERDDQFDRTLYSKVC